VAYHAYGCTSKVEIAGFVCLALCCCWCVGFFLDLLYIRKESRSSVIGVAILNIIGNKFGNNWLKVFEHGVVERLDGLVAGVAPFQVPEILH